ncbi:MAG: DUF4423 domain-containing protein, partial [Bdellovibrionaceae bacterium]|nr:DUF4423 domain-containing protein [Pseudobdellovibrionaceae bacterium]
LKDLYCTLFWPRKISEDVEEEITAPIQTSIRKRWLQPILREIRGDFSFVEIAEVLKLKSVATYHHWETGRREIPLPYLLMVIHKIQGRLQAFIDMLSLDLDFSEFKFLKLKLKFYEQFFSEPWIPTVLFSLSVNEIKKISSTQLQVSVIAKKLEIPEAHVEAAISVLLKLQLVKVRENRFLGCVDQYYAIPKVSDQKIEELRHFWFSRAEKLLQKPGFHRFEQHLTSREKKEKIISWIMELREKIREEVKSDESEENNETLIHIGWQVLELL